MKRKFKFGELEVLIPYQKEFYLYEKEIKLLYEKNQDKIADTNSFEFIRDNTFFYLFLLNKKPIGAIYYFKDDGKMFLNGFAIRKNLEANLACLKWSTTWFNCDIYAEAQNRASAYCLLRCGFKRINSKLFLLNQQQILNPQK